jgi:hypothetical protein
MTEVYRSMVGAGEEQPLVRNRHQSTDIGTFQSPSRDAPVSRRAFETDHAAGRAHHHPLRRRVGSVLGASVWR